MAFIWAARASPTGASPPGSCTCCMTLSKSCPTRASRVPTTPWRWFPFPGFIGMLAALGTFIMEFVGTCFYKRRHGEEAAAAAKAGHTTALLEDSSLAGATAAAMSGDDEKHTRAMHIVGMRACGGAPA
uniref:Uncharacterized protein n=1 Tax=Aegilops tauschii subsp. strangulata TaxID=200361 RepID=A0A453QT58_AEGTS